MIWKSLKSAYTLWRILSIRNITVGDSCRNPITGEMLSYTERCSLKARMLQEWMKEQGLIR